MFQPVSWPNMLFYRHILEPTKWGPPVVFVSLHIHQTIVIITIGPTEPSLFNSPIFGTPHLKNCASRSSWETCEKPPRRVASDNILEFRWMEPENLPETHKMQLQLQRWYYDNIISANLGKTRQIFHMYFFHVKNRHLKHGSLNVPIFHITQPLGIWSIMATIR